MFHNAPGDLVKIPSGRRDANVDEAILSWVEDEVVENDWLIDLQWQLFLGLAGNVDSIQTSGRLDNVQISIGVVANAEDTTALDQLRDQTRLCCQWKVNLSFNNDKHGNKQKLTASISSAAKLNDLFDLLGVFVNPNQPTVSQTGVDIITNDMHRFRSIQFVGAKNFGLAH